LKDFEEDGCGLM